MWELKEKVQGGQNTADMLFIRQWERERKRSWQGMSFFLQPAYHSRWNAATLTSRAVSRETSIDHSLVETLSHGYRRWKGATGGNIFFTILPQQIAPVPALAAPSLFWKRSRRKYILWGLIGPTH